MKTHNTKTMNIKKILLTFLVAVLPFITFSQAIFDEFEDMDDVTTVVVNKRAFDLMSRIEVDTQEGKEYVDMVKNLTGLRVLATESTSIASKMKTKVASYLKSSNLSELMRIKDKDANVKIYVKEGRDADHVKELFMFVNGLSKATQNSERKAEAVILSITGDIDLNKVSELTNQMKIKGGEHLKNVKKKN